MGLPSPPTLSLGYNWSLTYLPPAQTRSQLTLQRCVTAPALPELQALQGQVMGHHCALASKQNWMCFFLLRSDRAVLCGAG